MDGVVLRGPATYATRLGRPVAGKTGTTSSNKDGWFIGFSSGLTTGVWMGRDDAKAVRGLQGGTAPARAFHDFMAIAVARRPVETFDTQVPMPDWQLSPEEEMFGDPTLDANAMVPMVDENGMPLTGATEPGMPQQQPMVRPDGTGEPTQQWLDQVLPPQPRQRQPQPVPQPQPQPPLQPRSVPPPDPPEPRSGTP
jgi:penicillin-binding protein 1A